MMINFFIKRLPLFIILLSLATACDKFKDDVEINYTESIKAVDGTWKIVSASRNGTDITSVMDFSAFRLKMNTDHTYTIENYLPFVVEKAGTWEVDDPQYPFMLVFREEAESPSTLAMDFPVKNGKRQLILSFSPGCYSNIYTYVFEKEDN
ncbi:MAG: DUF5004 domain-containing protein [Candidatus Azobacteroides sp.]|nr:DUF5004 domain-containing protein [Candidatus Azobacteroides sp.]